MPNETRVLITSALDIVTARQRGRSLATELGFEGTEVTLVAAAISEVARNIVEYAKSGEILFQPVKNGTKQGLCVVARDQGPGIADVAQAMQYGFSTRQQALGGGLPGARWLMDDFKISSKPKKGTTVVMRKWLS